MNTDKTYAEQLAAEYAPKDTSRIVALRKLDRRAKLPATVLWPLSPVGFAGAAVSRFRILPRSCSVAAPNKHGERRNEASPFTPIRGTKPSSLCAVPLCTEQEKAQIGSV